MAGNYGQSTSAAVKQTSGNKLTFNQKFPGDSSQANQKIDELKRKKMN